MSLVRTSLLNGLAVAVRVSAAVLLNKFLAVFVGPAGYASVGQFQNALAVAASISGGIITSGITKGTAQHFNDVERQHFVWQNAIRLSLISTVICSVILLFCGPWFSLQLLHRNDFSFVFTWASAGLPAIAANNILLAIINGKKEAGIYVLANIAGSLINLFIVSLLSYFWGSAGALIALTASPAILLMVILLLLRRCSWFHIGDLWGRFQRPVLSELGSFAVMGVTSAMSAPLTYIFIRNHLSMALGLNSAGYWQASWKISEIYLMVITTTMSLYYLPRLAELKTAIELKREILKLYRFVIPVSVVCTSAIYISRNFIIHGLLSKEFEPMNDLFLWQLIGDVMKVNSWVLAFVMLGRAMVKEYVITEIVFSLAFYVLTRVLIARFGLQGVSIAYALDYAVYWAALCYLVRHEIRRMQEKPIQSNAQKSI